MSSAAEQQDAADKRRAIGALRAPSSMRRLQLILVFDGRERLCLPGDETGVSVKLSGHRDA
jgi:hypothetical protein